MMASTLRQVADFAACLQFEDLPATTVEKCKMLILDSLGCTIGAWRLPPAQLVLETAQALGGAGPVQIVGTDVRVPLAWGIFANSYGGNILDFDDVHPIAGHPGCTIIPPTLALLQEHPCGGEELIARVVAAYEIGMRIARAITPSPERAQQVIGFATWQIFTSVLVSARFLGCDAEQTAQAMAVAGTRAVVPYVRKSGRHERPYAWVKNNYGWTALGGFVSAWQARHGFRGNVTLLDGPRGFWAMAGSDRCDPEAFTHGLGDEYQILEVGVKPYPVCRHIHAALDGLCEILSEHGLSCHDVQKVEVSGPPAIAEDFLAYEPVDTIDAQFSIPYAMAMVLLGYEPGLGWLAPERIGQPEVMREARKVTAVPGRPEAEQAKADWPVRVSVLTRQGDLRETDVRIPRGHVERPMSPEQLQAKFRRLVTPTVGEHRCEELLTRVMELERSEALTWLSGLSSPA